MKTAFSGIVNLRKKNLQKCEHEIMQNENHIASKQGRINTLNSEFLALKMPKKGAFAIFRAFEEQKRAFANLINEEKMTLESLKAHKAQLQKRYKELNIEYEKVKFLEQKEQDKLIKKLQKDEKNQLDEVALMLYNNGGKAI